jgi:ABC-2 type transport system ATP-binding protein
MNPDDPIIISRGLSRSFKKVQALKQVDLVVNRGDLLGIVGPDGAGKTTLLRLFAGLLDITDGDASILGLDLGKKFEFIKSHTGYMAQQFSLYAELSVMENLRFFAEMFNVSPQEFSVRYPKLLQFAGLTEFEKRRADQLSGGMQKKLALACTLVHQPEILLLDEPTTGVDPVSRREFWNILTELHLQGTTILVSTPYMDEADRCSMVGLLYEGRLIEYDSPQQIRAGLNSEIIEVRSQDWRKVIQVVQDLPGIQEMQTYGESLHLLVDSSRKRLPGIKRAIKKAGIKNAEIRQAPVRMEEAFISQIRRLKE